MKVGGYLNSSLIRVHDQPYINTTANETTTSQKSDELTSSEKSLLTRLKATDTAVKRHEAAHIAAGRGVITSGANFIYQSGPDNKLYAIGGEVTIDTSPENTPEKTIPKMQTVRRAALAPVDPSSTDYQVAATASMIQMQARVELSIQLKEAMAQKGLDEYANNETSRNSFSIYA
jgi:hypothetical protein